MQLKQEKCVDFGKRSGLKIHPVSIGAIRLPQGEQDAVQLIRQAIDADMVYIDTCRGYRDSETKVGKALKDGYRQKVILSTKWSPWNCTIESDDNTSADCTYKRIIESMQRFDVEYLDFFQIWGINNREQWSEVTLNGGMLDGIRRAMREGLVRHTGFTTHDSPENISDYIDQADWCEVILFSHNVMNPTYKTVIAKAHRKGIGTILMNPLGGGMLAEGSPVLRKVVKEEAGTENVVETAHRYLAANENIDTILCGISRPSDVISTLKNYQKPPLSAEICLKLEESMQNISSKSLGFCTGCKYCMPCPSGIEIPGIMNAIYLHRILGCPAVACEHYGWYSANPPSKCVQCGQCAQKCTQKLDIINELKYAGKVFEQS